MTQLKAERGTFQLLDATVSGVRSAYSSGVLCARELVDLYLRRMDAYDQAGPRINSIISINDRALDEAAELDRVLAARGPVGPLHGVPVILKDQMDVAGMRTTLGSVLFEDYYPDKTCFVAEKLKAAGAIVLAKATLGELGGGDTHGTLFGSSRNPYDPERTVGGSSGGSAAAASANFATITIGQEGFASIRRPAAWNGVVGMRPTAGLVSRAGVYGGWPSRAGSLGPICRTVSDAATLLDVMAGYDPEDPITAHGYGRIPGSFTDSLDPRGLHGARIGVLTAPMGAGSEPGSDDFNKVTAVFERALSELEAAGATLIPVEIPGLTELLATRAGDGNGEAFAVWMARSANPPFRTIEEMQADPRYARIQEFKGRSSVMRPGSPEAHHEYMKAREELMTRLLQVVADNQLDALVHKTVEHQPTLISEGLNPPYRNHMGAPHVNTFLIYVPSITVPCGFTTDGLPAGITFLGAPYTDATMVRLAYAYEQATMHRLPPATTPSLAGEP